MVEKSAKFLDRLKQNKRVLYVQFYLSLLTMMLHVEALSVNMSYVKRPLNKPRFIHFKNPSSQQEDGSTGR